MTHERNKQRPTRGTKCIAIWEAADALRARGGIVSRAAMKDALKHRTDIAEATIYIQTDRYMDFYGIPRDNKRY